MKKFFSLHLLFAFALVLAVSGCAQMGLATPQTFDDRLGVAYGTVTAVRDAATTLVNADKITAADAQNVQDQANNARTGLDLAKSFRTTNPDLAQTKMATAIQVLAALQSYLTSRSTTP